MLQVSFSFRPLNIVGIIGQPTSSQDRLHLYELAPRYSNRFILGYAPRLENAQVWFKQHNIVIADAKGVIRDNIIHDFIPDPELSGVVSDALSKGDKVQLIGFGTFEVSQRAERVGINPKTKEKITIPASKSVKFKAGKALKDAVNA